jgi:hypothetical protein
MGVILLMCLSLLPGAPKAVALVPPVGGLTAAAFQEARTLADDQRFEEAIVEYQRALAAEGLSVKERAQGLFELSFLHFVLGDETNAETRGLEALETDAQLALPASAPPKQVELLTRMRRQFAARPRLTPAERRGEDAPNVVRVSVADPESKIARIAVRYALQQAGPFALVQAVCQNTDCSVAIPPPSDASFTAFYYLEALDATQATVARAGTPTSPLQLTVVSPKAWYKSPVVWGLTGAALAGVGLLVYFLSPPPPK